MSYSIVIESTDSIELNTILYSLDKFLEDEPPIIIITTSNLVSEERTLVAPFKRFLNKIKLRCVANTEHDLLSVSSLVKTPVYLYIPAGFILKRPLAYSSLIYDNKYICNLEGFPHGKDKWTNRREDWIQACNICHIKYHEMVSCMLMSYCPQVLFTVIATTLSNSIPVEFRSLLVYWFHIRLIKYDNSYTNQWDIWDPTLCLNDRNPLVPLDYRESSIVEGCKRLPSLFIAFKAGELADVFRKCVATPSKQEIKEILDEFVLYTTTFSMIRLGECKDGGYVICEIPASILIGIGVGNTFKFETDFRDKLGARCFLYDHTVDIDVSGQRNITFIKNGLDFYDHDAYISLETILKRHSAWGNTDLCLKCDIEGYEWLCLLFATDETLLHFNQIVIEFHWIDNDRNATIQQKRSVLQRLNSMFRLVHIHGINHVQPSNYDNLIIHPVLEATFVRKDLLPHSSVIQTPVLPHRLDAPNDLAYSDIVLSNFYPWNGLKLDDKLIN